MRPRITRRDFIHDVGIAALGLALPLPGLAAPQRSTRILPAHADGASRCAPGLLRGRACARARGQALRQPAGARRDLRPLVVGAGSAGSPPRTSTGSSRPAVADPDPRQPRRLRRPRQAQRVPPGRADAPRLGRDRQPGIHALQPGGQDFIRELGIDIPRLRKDYSFNWLGSHGHLKPALLFDAAHYGRDVLLPGVTLDYMAPKALAKHVDAFPLPTTRAEAQGLPARARRRARGPPAGGASCLPASHELHGFPAHAIRTAGCGPADFQQRALRILGAAGRASLGRGMPAGGPARRACAGRAA